MLNKSQFKLPEPIIENRKSICKSCNCNVDFSDPCSFCPKLKWTTAFCEDQEKFDIFLKNFQPSKEAQPPPLSEMAKSFVESAKNWALHGFTHTSEKTLKNRLETCQSCEFWKAEAFNNTGRCMKCGCSTWAKIRMATERCPIGKWGPETKASV